MNPINISFQATEKKDLPKGMKYGVSIVVEGHTFVLLEAKKGGMATNIENRFEKLKTDISNRNKSAEERKLNINKWIPIKMEDGQIFFIKTQEIFSKTLLGDEKYMHKTLGKMISQNIEDRVGLSGEAGIVFEGRADLLEPEKHSIEAQAEIITRFLLVTLLNEGTLLDTRPQLYKLFDRPLSVQLQESIILKNDLPEIDLNEIGNNSDVIHLRAGNSNTINKHSAESDRALSNWLEADKLVRDWASEKRMITLSDIQDLNRIFIRFKKQ